MLVELRTKIKRRLAKIATKCRRTGAIGFLRYPDHLGDFHRSQRSWYQWHPSGSPAGDFYPGQVFYNGNWKKIDRLGYQECHEILLLEWEPARPKHALELLAECAR